MTQAQNVARLSRVLIIGFTCTVFSFMHYYMSPDIDLTAIKRSIVKADIQHTLILTRTTMLVSNVFQL